MVFAFLCLTYFTQHNTLQYHLCCHKWQDLILLRLSPIPLYVYICVYACIYIHMPHFFIHSIIDGHLVGFILVSLNSTFNLGFLHLGPIDNLYCLTLSGGRLSNTLQDIQQHPCSLPTRCQQKFSSVPTDEKKKFLNIGKCDLGGKITLY